MLNKIIKYEFKSTARIFLPLCAATIALALLVKLSIVLASSFGVMVVPSALLIFLYGVSIVAALVITIGVSVYRFYKSMTGDGAYLTYALPVTTWQLVFAKLLAAVVWLLISCASVLLSVLICAYYKEFLSDAGSLLSLVTDAFTNGYGVKMSAAIIITVVALLLVCFAGYLMFYVSIAIGQLWRGHRLIGSILTYIGLSFLNQMLSVSFMTVIMRSFSSLWNQLSESTPAIFNLYTFWGAVDLLIFAVAAVYYLITCWLLRHRLNLE